MFGLFDIPIWTRSGGGVSAINEPGTYVLYVIIPVPSSLIGTSFNIPGSSWRLTVSDIKPWKNGSKVFIDVGPQVGVNEAGLSPLQIDAILGIGLLAAFALLVDRISKVSPLITFAVYGVILIVLVFSYVRWIHPWIKGRGK